MVGTSNSYEGSGVKTRPVAVEIGSNTSWPSLLMIIILQQILQSKSLIYLA